MFFTCIKTEFRFRCHWDLQHDLQALTFVHCIQNRVSLHTISHTALTRRSKWMYSDIKNILTWTHTSTSYDLRIYSQCLIYAIWISSMWPEYIEPSTAWPPQLIPPARCYSASGPCTTLNMHATMFPYTYKNTTLYSVFSLSLISRFSRLSRTWILNQNLRAVLLFSIKLQYNYSFNNTSFKFYNSSSFH